MTAEYREQCLKLAQVIEEVKADNDSLKADIEKYLTTAMAAAVEIQEHWDAHCDSEGYGPANLMRRLENGFPESYGYTAKSLIEMTIERDSLKAELAALRAQRMPMTGNQMDLLTTGSGAKLFISADQFASIVRAVEAFHDIKAQP